MDFVHHRFEPRILSHTLNDHFMAVDYCRVVSLKKFPDCDIPLVRRFIAKVHRDVAGGADAVSAALAANVANLDASPNRYGP